jgi:uncharacterized protein (TIGR04255 family)
LKKRDLNGRRAPTFPKASERERRAVFAVNRIRLLCVARTLLLVETVSQRVHAILDTDAFHLGREKFDAGALQSRLQALHDVIGTAFWATVTDRAKEAWR